MPIDLRGMDPRISCIHSHPCCDECLDRMAQEVSHMETAVVHYSDEEGYFVARGDRVFKPNISTKFDQGEVVVVIRPAHSSSYITVRSMDTTIVEDWRDVDT